MGIADRRAEALEISQPLSHPRPGGLFAGARWR